MFTIQNWLEECILQDDVSYRVLIENQSKGGNPKQQPRQRKNLQCYFNCRSTCNYKLGLENVGLMLRPET